MQQSIKILVVIAFIGSLAACRQQSDVESPTVNHSEVQTHQESTVQVEQEQDSSLEVLTADDMDALVDERADLIERGTPLGEENDEVLELQNQKQ